MPTAAENYEDRPVILYSPEGFDDRHVMAVARHFGKTTIIEGWKKDEPITDNALHTSTDPALKYTRSLTRKDRRTAYVFKLEDIIGQVQTSAHSNPADIPAVLQFQAH